MLPTRKALRTVWLQFQGKRGVSGMANGGPLRLSKSKVRPIPLSLTQFPKPDNTLESLTIEPGKDVISELSNFFKSVGALYTEKATGTVSCATLQSPNFKTVQSLNGSSYKIVSIYGPLPGETDPCIEDGLWVLLGNEAGEVFWGKALKPLIAETPVQVWIVR